MMTIDYWKDRHPDWFCGSTKNFYKTYDGWQWILDDALNACEQIINRYPNATFRVVQIKEKFGALTIHFRETGLPPDAAERVRDTMLAARERSFLVCEICGSAARLGVRKSIYSVRCASCADEGWTDIRQK